MALLVPPFGCDGLPTSTSDDPRILWRYPAVGLFIGEPSADEQNVFLAIKDSLIALDQQTGEPAWKQVPTGFFISTAAIPVEDGVVYVTNAGQVLAYDARSGQERWRTLLTPLIGIDYGGAAVEVGSQRVYTARRTTFQGPVYALDRQTGAILWHRLISPQPTRMIEIGELLCLGSDDTELNLPQGAVTCLSVSSGDIVWRFEVPDSVGGQRLCHDGGVQGPPAVAGNLLLVGDQCGQLFALNLETGAVVWRKQMPTAFDAEILVIADVAFACTRSSFCVAFRVADGSVLWTAELLGSAIHSPTVVGQVIYVVDLGGYLYKIDRTTGQVLARADPDEDTSKFYFRRPVYRNGRLFTGGGGWFYGLKAP